MNKSIFIKSLKKAFEGIGIDTGWGFGKRLAEKYGVTTQAVNEWLNEGKSTFPRLEILVKIARDTGVSIDSLILGQTESLKIPVLSYEMLSHIDCSLDFHSQGIQPMKWIAPIEGGISGLFALRHTGDSMLSSAMAFPEGTIIVLNIDKKNPPSGELVLAKLDNDQIVFRRYINEGKAYLMPLNTRYENYTSTFEILASFQYAIFKPNTPDE